MLAVFENFKIQYRIGQKFGGRKVWRIWRNLIDRQTFFAKISNVATRGYHVVLANVTQRKNVCGVLR